MMARCKNLSFTHTSQPSTLATMGNDSLRALRSRRRLFWFLDVFLACFMWTKVLCEWLLLRYRIISSAASAFTHGIVAGAFGAQKEGRYSVRRQWRRRVDDRHGLRRGISGGARS